MFFKTYALSTHTSRMHAAIVLSAGVCSDLPTCKGWESGWLCLDLDLAMLGDWPSIHASPLGSGGQCGPK